MKEKIGITAIFDISGCDMSNELLPYLDFDAIRSSEKRFYGYSDLSTILNAIYAKTGKEAVLCQIRNLLYWHGEEQRMDLINTLQKYGNDLYDLEYQKDHTQPDAVTLVRKFADSELPIAKTAYIGRGPDSKGAVTGRYYRF